jgi:hypothetical protein
VIKVERVTQRVVLEVRGVPPSAVAPHAANEASTLVLQLGELVMVVVVKARRLFRRGEGGGGGR